MFYRYYKNKAVIMHLFKRSKKRNNCPQAAFLIKIFHNITPITYDIRKSLLIPALPFTASTGKKGFHDVVDL